MFNKDVHVLRMLIVFIYVGWYQVLFQYQIMSASLNSSTTEASSGVGSNYLAVHRRSPSRFGMGIVGQVFVLYVVFCR